MAIYTVNWTTRKGKRRVLRLYKAYHNMLQRTRGLTKDGCGIARWEGLEVGFTNWPEFRAWAIANGYRKRGLALDRKEESKGYTPDNCQWITVPENTAKATRFRLSKKATL